ncbi:MAG: peptidylprolyl isomerase [Planctomycetes bacterium]|nr:peptidylprolyl isomerase [Planctomycetota bacterium]
MVRKQSGSRVATQANIFDRRGWKWGSWLVSVGCVAGVCLLANRLSGPGAVQAQAPATGKSAGSAKGPAPAANGDKGAPGSRIVAPRNGKSLAGVSAAKESGKSGPVNPSAAEKSGGERELKVVAMVGGEQISRQDLGRECVARYGKDVLETIINKHLILQACKEREIMVSEQDVEDEVRRIASKFNLSVDRWLQLLSEERHVTAREYKTEIIWPTLALRRIAHDQVQVSDDELKKAFESEFGPQVRVRLIAVRDARKAQELRKQAAAKPAEFENLAKDHSEDPSASVMGLVPPIRKHLGDAELERAAFALKPNQVSQVIEVGKDLGPANRQYVILKCEEQITARPLGGEALKEARNNLADRVRDQKLRTASSDIFAGLQKQAKLLNVFNEPALQQKHPGVAAFINGQAVTMRDLSEECIGRHGATVLDGEINRRIIEQELRRRNKNVEESDLFEEIARAADAYGFIKNGKPDVDAWLKKITEEDGATVEVYTKDVVWPSAALKKLVSNKAEVTREDLDKAFEANFGERVQIMAIVLSNQRSAQQVWEEARKNPSETRFGDLAQQYSVEPASRANFGKVPPIRRHGGQPLIEEHAFKLKPGELSPIIGVGDKFIILRCMGRTKPEVVEMDAQIHEELSKDIFEKKLRVAMNKEFDRLKESTACDNFLTGSTSDAKARNDKSLGKTSEPSSVVPASATAPLRGKSTK